MAERKSFVMYINWGDFFQNMTNEEIGDVVRSIYALEMTGIEQEPENRVAAIIYSGIREKLLADIEEYAKTCDKRAEASAKGVEARREKNQKKSNGNVKQPNGFEKQPRGFREQPSGNQMVGDTDTENDTENKTDTEKDGVSPIVPFTAIAQVPKVEEDDLQSLGVPAELCEQVSEWIENRDAKGKTLTEAELKSFVSMVKAKAKEHGAQAVADLIQESMSNGYKGVTWDRLDRNRGKPKNTYIDRIDHRLDVVDEWARSSGAFEEAQ